MHHELKWSVIETSGFTEVKMKMSADENDIKSKILSLLFGNVYLLKIKIK